MRPKEYTIIAVVGQAPTMTCMAQAGDGSRLTIDLRLFANELSVGDKVEVTLTKVRSDK